MFKNDEMSLDQRNGDGDALMQSNRITHVQRRHRPKEEGRILGESCAARLVRMTCSRIASSIAACACFTAILTNTVNLSVRFSSTIADRFNRRPLSTIVTLDPATHSAISIHIKVNFYGAFQRRGVPEPQRSAGQSSYRPQVYLNRKLAVGALATY